MGGKSCSEWKTCCVWSAGEPEEDVDWSAAWTAVTSRQGIVKSSSPAVEVVTAGPMVTKESRNHSSSLI